MPNFLKKLPGAVMAALALFSGVGPHEAASHLAEWASLIGVENVPTWLTGKAADRWGLAIGIIGFLAWGFWYYGVYGKIRGRDENDKTRMGVK